MALAALRKLRCSSLHVSWGNVKLDQVEAQVNALIIDLKGPDNKLNALKRLPPLTRFLSSTQKQEVRAALLNISKLTDNDQIALALALLEPLIDADSEGVIMKDKWVSHLYQLLVGPKTLPNVEIRKGVFRCLLKLAEFKHNRKAIVDEGVLARAVREIGEHDQTKISSDACVKLIGTLAGDSPAHAEFVVRNYAVPSLVALLRPTAPSKFYTPALRALVTLSHHDDRTLRLIIEAGAVASSMELMQRQHVIHPEVGREAALALCEFVTTKNVEIQDLLIQQRPGQALLNCLQHKDPDVKRSAIIAVERWLYNDDRMIQLAIEFFLTMSKKGVEVSPKLQQLLQQLQPIAKPNPNTLIIDQVIEEIRKRPPDSVELTRVRNENTLLKSQLAYEAKRAQTFENVITQQASSTNSTSTSPSVAAPNLLELVKSTSSLKELEALEKQIVERRTELHKKELEAYKDLVTCVICLENTKDTTLVPCGHVLCGTCAGKILANVNARQRKCPFCQKAVEKTTKLYL